MGLRVLGLGFRIRGSDLDFMMSRFLYIYMLSANLHIYTSPVSISFSTSSP